MTRKTKPKQVQVYDPKTKRWVKVSTQTGAITGRKGTAGPYAGILKRKTMPRRRKAAAPPEASRRTTARRRKTTRRRKTGYDLPAKITSMVHGSKQSAIGGGTAKTRAGRKASKTPTKIKDLGRVNLKTQMMRIKCDRLQKLPVITGAKVAADILDGMAKNDREEIRVLYLNSANRVIGVESSHTGSVSASICSPHEVFKSALMLNASGLIIAHNHPSGNPKPSDADLINARKFTDAGRIMDVKVLDSIIIGDGKFYSLQETGEL